MSSTVELTLYIGWKLADFPSCSTTQPIVKKIQIPISIIDSMKENYEYDEEDKNKVYVIYDNDSMKDIYGYISEKHLSPLGFRLLDRKMGAALQNESHTTNQDVAILFKEAAKKALEQEIYYLRAFVKVVPLNQVNAKKSDVPGYGGTLHEVPPHSAPPPSFPPSNPPPPGLSLHGPNRHDALPGPTPLGPTLHGWHPPGPYNPGPYNPGPYNLGPYNPGPHPTSLLPFDSSLHGGNPHMLPPSLPTGLHPAGIPWPIPNLPGQQPFPVPQGLPPNLPPGLSYGVPQERPPKRPRHGHPCGHPQ